MKKLQLQIIALFIALILIVLGIAVLMNITEDNSGHANNTVVDLATYDNQRFNYRVSYPQAVFVLKEESQNNDGITLSSQDNMIRLQGYASYNVLNESFEDLVEQAEAEFGRIDNVQKSQKTVVIRGESGGANRVERVELSDNTVYHLVISYPTQALTNATVDTILNSFTVYQPE